MKVNEGEARALPTRYLLLCNPPTRTHCLYSICGGQVTIRNDILKPQEPRFPLRTQPGSDKRRCHQGRMAAQSTQMHQHPIGAVSVSVPARRQANHQPVRLANSTWQSVIDAEARWPSHQDTRLAEHSCNSLPTTVWDQSFHFKNHWISNFSSTTTK